MSKQIILLYCMVILLLPMSCSHNSVTRTLKRIKKVSVLSEGMQRYSCFNLNNKDYICHYDFVTKKKILVQSLDGIEKYSIDLKNVIQKGHQIIAFDIIDSNNIIVVPSYAKWFFIIDRKGNIKKKIDMSFVLSEPKDYRISYAINNHIVFNDTSLLFPIEFTMNNIPDSLTADPSAYNKARYKAARLLKIDNFYSDSLVCHLGGGDLYQRFTAEDVISIESPNYQFVNEKIFFSSSYTDSIYIINQKTLQALKGIKIKSKHTDLIINHVTGEQVMNSNENLLTYNSFTDGHIINYTYDHLSHHYLVTLFHKPDQTEDIYSAVIGHSIAVLDSSFTQIDEIEIDYKTYSPLCYASRKGIYLGTKTKTNSRNDNTALTLLKYE